MRYPGTVLIAEISGAAPYELDAWTRTVPPRLAGREGIARVARYRKINDIRFLIVAEAESAEPLAALKAAVADLPAKFAVDFIVARQKSEIQRADFADDVRDLHILYTVTFNVPADRIADLGDWYDREHAPLLQASPFWPGTRRFHVDRPAPAHWGTHLALHYISDLQQTLRAPERTVARNTPWRARLITEPWYPENHKYYFTQEP